MMYLVLMDPDPGDPKIYGSGSGSALGSATLSKGQIYFIMFIFLRFTEYKIIKFL